MEKNSSKQILLSVLGVAILVVAVVGISFAAFSYTGTGAKVNTITTGTITMSYTEDSNAIAITNALPISDTAGMALTGTGNVFDFTVKTTVSGEATVNYLITAVEDATTDLPNTAVKVYLTTGASGSETQSLAPTKVSALTKTTSGNSAGAPSGEYILKSGSTTADATDVYHLRMWVADDYADVTTSKSYKLKVNVYGAAAAQ